MARPALGLGDTITHYFPLVSPNVRPSASWCQQTGVFDKRANSTVSMRQTAHMTISSVIPADQLPISAWWPTSACPRTGGRPKQQANNSEPSRSRAEQSAFSSVTIGFYSDNYSDPASGRPQPASDGTRAPRHKRRRSAAWHIPRRSSTHGTHQAGGNGNQAGNDAQGMSEILPGLEGPPNVTQL